MAIPSVRKRLVNLMGKGNDFRGICRVCPRGGGGGGGEERGHGNDFNGICPVCPQGRGVLFLVIMQC